MNANEIRVKAVALLVIAVICLVSGLAIGLLVPALVGLALLLESLTILLATASGILFYRSWKMEDV